MPLRLHVVIISWDGYHDRARAIADALVGEVDALSVVTSNARGTAEDGPGEWVLVPQSWYFGRKFRAALDLVADDTVMLQIQADTHSDDWPAVARACARAFAERPDIGLWIPDITWTPWPVDVVSEGEIPGTPLLRVAQTDGIVWALHPDLLPSLRALDYEGNNLGWGIDWVALHEAAQQGRIAVRDLSCPVHHPQSRGYDNAEAAQHMKNFLGQLPGPAQREIMDRYHALAARARRALGQTDRQAPPPHRPPPLPFLRQPQIAEIALAGGEVFVRAAGRDFAARADVLIGEIAYPLAMLDGTPPRGLIPQRFPMHAVDTPTAYQQRNDLGEWQVDGWQSLRVIPDFAARTQSIPLSGHLLVDPQDGAQVFCAQLAVHRGKGDLVVRLMDSIGRLRHEVRTPFDTVFAGGNSPQGYKFVRLPLPETREQLSLELRIDCTESFETSAEQPAVFFLAEPRICAACDGPISPVLSQSDRVRGDTHWYHCTLPVPFGDAARRIVLRYGGWEEVLATEPAARVTLTADHGGALDLGSDTTLEASVWFNGVPGLALTLSPGTTRMHIPAAYLTGAPLFIELRDASGSFAYWRHWCAPTAKHDPAPPAISGPLARDLPARYAAVRKHLATPSLASPCPA
ncbi:hypothetical protein KDD17_14070 [Sulfitobacter albidus]|uniref:Uncharacterized protein n=1 Tax=Sulfitobacter albidus TaxID=2829501 RepID=A0A975PMA8_9RHOB|nr:hypothetical protein [Sulfitobacter albidus]QUJ76040.1 hypothetical protein KDD17_14070 [Sulfitobacter albidus]